MILLCAIARMGLVFSCHLMTGVDDSLHYLRISDLVDFLIHGCYLNGYPRIQKTLEFKKATKKVEKPKNPSPDYMNECFILMVEYPTLSRVEVSSDGVFTQYLLFTW